MKYRPSYTKLDSFKRIVFFMLMALFASSFLSKNVLFNYSNDKAELIELLENSEETETETERGEDKKEIDDYTSVLGHFVQQTKVMSHYAENTEYSWITRYSEVLTPPPDLV
ncbi:MAG: hypothetical protein CL823_04120 [Crocinitomicaceae bacterium]|nr:hypothetical protein [Crocinitomicaceae bacterium]